MDKNYINNLAKQLHQTTIDNGWTQIERTQDDYIMLMKSELFESFEAIRKNKFCSPQQLKFVIDCPDGTFKSCFEECIKDTFQDELADLAIRVLDTAAFYKLEMEAYGFVGTAEKGNLVTDLKALDKMLTGLYDEPLKGNKLSSIFNYILSLADRNEILLGSHIALKNSYNKLRGQRHGNKTL